MTRRETTRPGVEAGMPMGPSLQLPMPATGQGTGPFPLADAPAKTAPAGVCAEGDCLAKKRESGHVYETPKRMIPEHSTPIELAVRQDIKSTEVRSPAPKHLITIKPLGYVEKADGQLEAIIVQDDHAQVVHTGEVFGGRYRVVKISPDSVEAVEEAVASAAPQVPAEDEPAKSGAGTVAASQQAQVRAASLNVVNPEERTADPANSGLPSAPLGYVERKDGRVDVVVADGEGVRLVPQDSPTLVAERNDAHHQGSAKRVQASLSHDVSPVPQPFQLAVKAAPKGQFPSRPPATMIRSVSLGSPGGETRSVSPLVLLGEGTQPARRGAEKTAREVPMEDASRVVAPPSLPYHAAEAARTVLKPIGFVKKADGEIEAVVSEGDEVFVVTKGDYFARRYRALRVSPDAVEVAEGAVPEGSPPSRPPSPKTPERLTASLSHGTFGRPASLGDVRQNQNCTQSAAGRPTSERSAAVGDNSDTPTLAFQTLGYIETLTGDIEAIVADGSSVYLVKQGERFADTYRAVTVSPTLVLAVRANPGWNVDGMLAARTDSRAESASKLVYGTLHSPAFGKLGPSASGVAAAPASPALRSLGVSFLNTLGLAELDQE